MLWVSINSFTVNELSTHLIFNYIGTYNVNFKIINDKGIFSVIQKIF